MWHTYSMCGTKLNLIDAPSQSKPTVFLVGHEPTAFLSPDLIFSQCRTQRPQLGSLVLVSLTLCGKQCDLSWCVSQRCWYTEWDECSSQRLALIWALLLSELRGQYTSACVWDWAWSLVLSKSTHIHTSVTLAHLWTHTGSHQPLRKEKKKSLTQNLSHWFPDL